MRRKSAGGRPRPLRVLRGGKANCSRFHCSSVRSVGYKVVFCILPYSKPRLDIRCPRTQKDQKMIFQTRSEREVPTEIDRFVARLPYSCSEPEFVHSRQSAVREWVTEVAGAYENGWDLVRSAARAKLGDDDASMVERA